MATAAKRALAPVTDDPDTLPAALAAAFAEFEAASKSANNPHFKSKYADLSAVMDAVKPALINHGLFFTQMTHDADGGVCIETIIHHRGGDNLSCGKLFVPASKQDAQGFGSALTYARRYSLMTAFGIPAEDDDGNAAARSAPANDRNGRHSPSGKIDDAQFVTLQGLMEGTGADVRRFCQFFQISGVKDLPASRFQEAVDAINASAAARRQKEPA
jgi:hypothetical protein